MAKVQKQPEYGLAAWFKNQLWNTSLPVLAAAIIGGIWFYFETKTSLSSQATAISELKTKATETQKEDAADRAKVREQFLADSKVQTAGIAELNKQTAVMSSVLTGIQRELEKIGQKLDAPQARGR